RLIKKTHSYNEQEKSILNILKKNHIRIPKNKIKRKRLFTRLAQNLRSQTGQKNNIVQGLRNFQAFKKPIKRFFKTFDAPYELRAVAFLESSFNINAKSKVGATGVWQFVRFIGKHFMRINKVQDERLNPIISTLGALHLLKQNYKILGRWDLAVTAYNSGTKHLLKARRKLGVKKPTLSQVLKTYDHPHLGFASTNFYASFLALVHALSYQDELYKLKYPRSIIRGDYNNLHVYVSHCDLNPKRFFQILKKSSEDLRYFNNHIIKNEIDLPKGSIIISDINLTNKRFSRIAGQKLRNLYPKNYFKYSGKCIR
ncbi:MAG: lytic transglycosylase domain-containing protein, partial [Bdellovibrionales bacterium]|nr:lytic transglycosylase domain-containing protein [Bdellovibrionales bacterium]